MQIPENLYLEGFVEKNQEPKSVPVIFNQKVLQAQKFIRENFKKQEEINHDFPAFFLNIIFQQKSGIFCSRGEFILACIAEGFQYDQSKQTCFNVDEQSVRQAERKSCFTMVTKLPICGEWDGLLEKAQGMDEKSLNSLIQDFITGKPAIPPFNFVTLTNSLSDNGLMFMVDERQQVRQVQVFTREECLDHWGFQKVDK